MRRTALSLLVLAATSCGSTPEYALPPAGPHQYDLARQKEWICDEDGRREDEQTLGAVLTTVGAVAATTGAAWLTERAAKDRPAPTGAIVLTVGGVAALGSGIYFLHAGGERRRKVAHARADYAHDLEAADLRPPMPTTCSNVVSGELTAAQRANAAADKAEKRIEEMDEALARANDATVKALHAAEAGAAKAEQ